jgi:hypothetical protein
MRELELPQIQQFGGRGAGFVLRGRIVASLSRNEESVVSDQLRFLLTRDIDATFNSTIAFRGLSILRGP